MIIPLVRPLPAGSSDQPGNSGGQPSNAPLFGLAPGGVCLAPDVTTGTGELLPHRFTLTLPASGRGGLLSVALSSSSPRLGVTQHPALWSPDFPPASLRRSAPAGDHLPCSGSIIRPREDRSFHCYFNRFNFLCNPPRNGISIRTRGIFQLFVYS